jgi:hypothetical protein
MRGVLQDDVSAAHGNALQACIASILELELNEVPNFIKSPEYLGRMRGLDYAYVAHSTPRGACTYK